MAKNFPNSVFLSALGKRALMVSLKAKLKAWVGKYRAIVTGDFSTDNLGVSILGLDEELDTLNGSRSSLSNCARHTSGKEVDDEFARAGHL